MEALTGIMIAFLIFVSAKLVLNNELEVSNFFSFLAAMMLAYQPVRSLATLNMLFNKAFLVLEEFYQLLMNKMKLKMHQCKRININNGEIRF